MDHERSLEYKHLLDYRNRSFPGWAGPPIGAIGGAGAALKLLYREGFPNDVNSWAVIGVGAGGGLLAGLIVWAWDLRSKGHRKSVDKPPPPIDPYFS